jgi:hypothetical protein
MRRSVAAVAALMVFTGTASAQAVGEKAKVMPPMMEALDHSKMEKEMGSDHAMSPWKELDAYHMLMMATWHPAKDKNDLAPTRAKATEMVTAAKTLAASMAPKGCDAPKLKETAAALPAATQGVADLVAKKSDDATLKAAMKELHDKFDVLEMGCTMPKPDKK